VGVPVLTGKRADVTGPRRTGRWGVTCTDLGASVTAPNGKLVSVFGDTFSGRKVGRGDWRSPVILIGTGDANNRIVYERAGGPDPDYARQLWHYDHDEVGSGWTRSGISTVIPSDLLCVRDMLYLHVIVNRGFGNVVWTEIWRSDDSGVSWSNMGDGARFPADLHDGHAQCWSWDYDRRGDWVYVVSTGFQRDKGIILRRVRPAHIGDRSKYWAWGAAGDRWSWGRRATPITPAGETWGELTLRRLITGEWVLGGFISSSYALGYRVLGEPTAELAAVPLQTPVFGTGWRGENHANNKVAQLYGGYVLPGSQLDIAGGVGLVVSQWRTDRGWPYRAMQFNVTLRDTTTAHDRESLR
jgi:Domain of unknown function (DUF4185)